MSISEGQYRYLKRKLHEIDAKLSDLNYKLDQVKASQRKHLLDFEEAIPPKSVCEDALSMLGVGNYKGMLRCLGDYYGIVRLQLLHDPSKVPEEYVACYHSDEGVAYSKSPVEPRTVLHELFHHLVANRVVIVYEGDDEETLASRYAELFLQRMEKTKT